MNNRYLKKNKAMMLALMLSASIALTGCAGTSSMSSSGAGDRECCKRQHWS